MFLAPLIISGFFVLLIIFFPFIIKCIFKFSSCVGYCIGFCCSVLTMLIIVVCSIGILCAIFIPLKDDIDSKKINSENILQHITTLYISIVIGIIIIIFLSVFFIMLFFTKKVSTPNYTYSSIFMFISGYTLAFIFAFTAIGLYCAFEKDINKDRAINAEIESKFWIICNFIVFGYILQLSGCAILFLLYHRNKIRAMVFIAAGVYFGPIIFIVVGFFVKIYELVFYPFFVFDLISIVIALIYYCRNATEVVVPENPSPILLNSIEFNY